MKFDFDLGNIKSLFVEDDPAAAVAKVATEELLTKPVRPVATIPYQAGPALNEQNVIGFVEKLRTKTQSIPSAEALRQFLDTVESLADSLPDEGGRYRAALKVLNRQQIDMPKLNGALADMSKALETEGTKFASVVADQRQKEITVREEKVSELDRQIEALSKQREDLTKAIIDEGARIDGMEASFGVAAQSVQAEITDLVNKFRIYIAPPATASKV